MEITPEIVKAWDNYCAARFSEQALMELYVACDQHMGKMTDAIHILSGSQDTVTSNQHYRDSRTLVPLGFQFK